MPANSSDWLTLGVSLGLTFVAAAIGGAITARPVQTWYRSIRKPPWNPPDRLFGPVWTLLYVLMAIALWQVWRMGWDQPGVRPALTLFFIQLGLNVLWSAVFFGWKKLWWAFAEICVLWVFIAATALAFFGLQPVAGWLLVPYIAWVTFAAILNFSVSRLNR
jgi:benzodiazapine receptor